MPWPSWHSWSVPRSSTPPSAAVRSSAQGNRFGVPAVLTATLAWGAGSVAVKLVSASGVTTVMLRLWLAVPVSIVILAAAGRRLRWDAARHSIPGGVLFGAHVLLFFSALRLTSVANVTFIGALQPAIVLLVAGRLLDEKVTTRLVLLSACAMAGVGLIVYGNDGSDGALVGDLLAVANVLVWTWFFLYTKRTRDRHGVDAADYQATIMVIAAVVVTPVALLLGADAAEIDGWDWFWLSFVVLVPGTLGHLTMNWAHRYVDATVSSLIILGVPVVATAGAAMFLGESMTALQMLGAGVVLVSIGAIVVRQRGVGADELAQAMAESETS